MGSFFKYLKTRKLLYACTLLLFFMMGCSNYYEGPMSEHYDGNTFYDPQNNTRKSFFSFLRWKFTSKKGSWPKELLPNKGVTPLKERVEGDDLIVTYIGHATFLIQTQGLNILTDPIFSDRASPVTFAGPKRAHPPSHAINTLPPIDVILLSHNHYDHLDLKSLEAIWEKYNPRIITPLGNDSIIEAHNASIIVETYDWGQSVDLSPEVEVFIEPMQHWSARTFWDRNKALWAAFTLKTSGGNLYVAGDSGYGNYFKESFEKHGSYRFAILPIGAYHPRWFMQAAHMTPEEALIAFQDLGLPYTAASHFDIFQLGDEPYGEALKRLEEAKSFPKAKRFKALEVGQQWNVPLI